MNLIEKRKCPQFFIIYSALRNYSLRGESEEVWFGMVSKISVDVWA